MQRVVSIEEICGERCDLPNVGRLVRDDDGDENSDSRTRDLYLLHSIRRDARFLARATRSKRPSAESGRTIDITGALAGKPSVESPTGEEQLSVSISQSYPGWLQLYEAGAEPKGAMRNLEQVLLSQAVQFLTCFSFSAFIQPQTTFGGQARSINFRNHPYTVPAGTVLTLGNTFNIPEKNTKDSKFACWRSFSRIFGNKNSATDETLVQCSDAKGRRLLFPLGTNGYFYAVAFDSSQSGKNPDKKQLVYQIKDLNKMSPLPSHVRIVYGPLITGSDRILIDNDLELFEKRDDKCLLACRIANEDKQSIEEFPSNCGINFEISSEKFTINLLDKSDVNALKYCNDNLEDFMINIQIVSQYQRLSSPAAANHGSKVAPSVNHLSLSAGNCSSLNSTQLASPEPTVPTTSVAVETVNALDTTVKTSSYTLNQVLLENHCSALSSDKQDSGFSNDNLNRGSIIELDADIPDQFKDYENIPHPDVFRVLAGRPTSDEFCEPDSISVPEAFRSSICSKADVDSKDVDSSQEDISFSLEEAKTIRDLVNSSTSDDATKHRNSIINCKVPKYGEDHDIGPGKPNAEVFTDLEIFASEVNSEDWMESEDRESGSDKLPITSESVSNLSLPECNDDETHLSDAQTTVDGEEDPDIETHVYNFFPDSDAVSKRSQNRYSMGSDHVIDTSSARVPSQFFSDEQDEMPPGLSDLPSLEIPAPESFSGSDGIQNQSPLRTSSDVTIKELKESELKVDDIVNETSNASIESLTELPSREGSKSDSATSNAFDDNGYLIPVENRLSNSNESNSQNYSEDRNQKTLSPQISYSKDDPNMMMILQRHGSGSQGGSNNNNNNNNNNSNINDSTTQNEARYDSDRLQMFLEDSVANLHKAGSFTSSMDDGQGSVRSEVISRQHSVPWTRRPSDPSHTADRTRNYPSYRRQNSGRLLEGVNKVQSIDEDGDISDFDNSSSHRNGSISRNQDSGLYIDLLDRRDSETDLLWMPIGALKCWSVEEVVLALRYIGIKEDVVMEFSKEKVDGGLLADMTPEIIKEAFPMMNALQRNKLMKLIEGWRPKHTMHSYI